MYNVSAYVERCLLSVMRQTRPANECIIVDDASPDDSIAKCERLIAEYTGPTRFIFLHHNEKRGLSATRNTGTDAATCDYIIYVDSDDELTTDCLEKLSQPIMKDGSIEMVMGNYLTNRDEMPLPWWQRLLRFNYSLENTPSELCTNEQVLHWFYKGKSKRPPYVWNRLLKLDFIENHQLYNKEGVLFEDQFWNYKLVHCLRHAAFVNDITYQYHIRPGSIITSTKREDELMYRGFFFEEYAKNVVPSMHIEETEYYFKGFCEYYIDSYNNPNYQYAYRIFRRELSDGHHRKCIIMLILALILGKDCIGRVLFKILTRTYLFIKQLI